MYASVEGVVEDAGGAEDAACAERVSATVAYEES